MREIRAGETIGTVECPGCGAQTPLKVNARKNVYFFCAKRLGEKPAEGKQEICLTRMNYGRAGSKKIIEQFLATEKVTDDVQHEVREVDTGDAGATTGGGEQHERDQGGNVGGIGMPSLHESLGSAIKRFLTE